MKSRCPSDDDDIDDDRDDDRDDDDGEYTTFEDI